MKHIRFKFYGKTDEYSTIISFMEIKEDDFSYNFSNSYVRSKLDSRELQISIPKREGVYLVTFGENDSRVVYCVDNKFYFCNGDKGVIYCDTQKIQKAAKCIAYIDDKYLNELGIKEKRFEEKYLIYKEYADTLYRGSLEYRLNLLRTIKYIYETH